MLKAKYSRLVTPNFETSGYRDSFICMSLFGGKALIDDGYLWRVRDGASNDIWRDKWLDKTPPSTAIAHTNISPILLRVCELIDQSRSWKFDDVVQ